MAKQAKNINPSSSDTSEDGEEGSDVGDDSCIVCGGDSSTSKNPIVFCDGANCDIPVHQRCAGIKEIPPGDEKWFCDRCMDKVPVDNTDAICCKDSTGCFKKTNQPKKYIHVQCAHYNLDINTKVEPMKIDMDLISKHECCICKDNYGICCRCCYQETPSDDNTRCSRYFHVTCAAKSYFEIKGGFLRSRKIYCNEHASQKPGNPQQNQIKRKLSNTPEPDTRSKKRAFSGSSASSTNVEGRKYNPSVTAKNTVLEKEEKPTRERSVRPFKISRLTSDEDDNQEANDSSDDGGLGTSSKKLKSEGNSSGRKSNLSDDLFGRRSILVEEPESNSIDSLSGIRSVSSEKSFGSLRSRSIEQKQNFSGDKVLNTFGTFSKSEAEKIQEIQRTVQDIRISQNRLEQYIKSQSNRGQSSFDNGNRNSSTIPSRLQNNHRNRNSISNISDNSTTFDITSTLDCITNNYSLTSGQNQTAKMQQENNNLKQELEMLKKTFEEERKNGKQYREQLITLFDYLRLPQLGVFDPLAVDDYLGRLVSMVQKSFRGNGITQRDEEIEQRNQIIQKVLEGYETIPK